MDDYGEYDDFAIEAEYEDLDDDFEDDDLDEDYDDDDLEDADDMLEAMVEDYDEADPEDMAEFFWGKKRRRRRARKARDRARRARIKTARGKTAYRGKTKGSHVTQAQLKSSLGRVGRDVRRNAVGIKQVNKRLSGFNSRVSANSQINRLQSMQMAKFQKTQRALGVMDFVQAYDPNSNELDTFQLLKGAVSSGFVGNGKGAMHNPYLLGGLALILRNNGGLGGLFGNNKD